MRPLLKRPHRHASATRGFLDPSARDGLRWGRLLASAAVLIACLVLSPRRVDVRLAEAGQKSQSFKVSAQLVVGCTFTVADMTFPNYTTGQNSIDNGASSYQIFCSSATVGVPVPVTYTVTAPGGFRMSKGASLLNYELCFDAACTAVIPNGVGTAFLVDRQLYSQPYYGQIPAHQLGAVGVYSQVVSVTITF
jgi:spore coat protein U-like protein